MTVINSVSLLRAGPGSDPLLRLPPQDRGHRADNLRPHRGAAGEETSHELKILPVAFDRKPLNESANN